MATKKSYSRLAVVRYEDKAAMDAGRDDWLNPIAMQSLKTATGKRAKTVVLNGKVFDLSYGHMQKTIVGDPYECVKVKPANGDYAPIGYVSLKRLERFQFDQEES